MGANSKAGNLHVATNNNSQGGTILLAVRNGMAVKANNQIGTAQDAMNEINPVEGAAHRSREEVHHEDGVQTGTGVHHADEVHTGTGVHHVDEVHTGVHRETIAIFAKEVHRVDVRMVHVKQRSSYEKSCHSQRK